MSDEDDYMSDAFLNQIEDKRPGLVPKHVARQYQQQRKEKTANEKNKQKPRAVLEKEKREEGLGAALTSDNKGFSMLQKMGFKPGMALGKAGTGRSEPVPVEVKIGRGGLGQESEKKRQKQAISEWYKSRTVKRQKLETESKQTFLKRMNEKMASRTMEKDLYKSQKVCEQLDSELGIKEPHEIFFWPEGLLPKTQGDTDDDDDNDDDAALQRPDKGYSNFVNDVDDDDDENNDDDDDDDGDGDGGSHSGGHQEEHLHYNTEEKLEVITVYLRTKHKYCIWCGIKYTDKEDLMSNCPGPLADLHEDL